MTHKWKLQRRGENQSEIRPYQFWTSKDRNPRAAMQQLSGLYIRPHVDDSTQQSSGNPQPCCS